MKYEYTSMDYTEMDSPNLINKYYDLGWEFVSAVNLRHGLVIFTLRRMRENEINTTGDSFIVLEELVQLKLIRESLDKIPEEEKDDMYTAKRWMQYENRKKIAWENAFKVILP